MLMLIVLNDQIGAIIYIYMYNKLDLCCNLLSHFGQSVCSGFVLLCSGIMDMHTTAGVAR